MGPAMLARQSILVALRPEGAKWVAVPDKSSHF